MPKWIWIPLVCVGLVALVFAVFSSSGDKTEVDLSQFVADVQAGQVDRVEVDDQDIEYTVRDDEVTYATEMERGDTVRTVLTDSGVEPGSPNYPEVELKEASSWSTILQIIIQLFPIVLIVSVVFYFIRRAQRNNARSRVTNLDPVCGQTVNPSSSAGSSTFQDVTYYFCSDDHKTRFDADPVSFLLKK